MATYIKYICVIAMLATVTNLNAQGTAPVVAPTLLDSVQQAVKEVLGDRYKVIVATTTDTTKATPATTPALTGRQAAMNMAGTGNSRGCFHAGIYGKKSPKAGKFWMENCNGWTIAGGPEVQLSRASSELGEFTNTVVGGIVTLGYEYYWFSPSLSYFKGTNMSIEGCSINTDELIIEANIFPWRHAVVSPGIGINGSFRDIKSKKMIQLGDQQVNFPYEGVSFSFGAQANMDIRLGHTKHRRTYSDGEYTYNYEKHGELDLRLSARYNHHVVDKLKDSQVQDKLKLDVLSISATLIWRLP